MSTKANQDTKTTVSDQSFFVCRYCGHHVVWRDCVVERTADPVTMWTDEEGDFHCYANTDCSIKVGLHVAREVCDADVLEGLQAMIDELVS